MLNETRSGRNIQHEMGALLRQSVYSRLGGYEDVNDADRLSVDPAMRAITRRLKEHKNAASRLKEVLATYRKAEDLINIGAYAAGSNPKIDYAIKMIDQVNAYLKQGIEEKEGLDESIQKLRMMFEDASGADS